MKITMGYPFTLLLARCYLGSLLDKLLSKTAAEVLPESLCGFKHGKGMADMIF